MGGSSISSRLFGDSEDNSQRRSGFSIEDLEEIARRNNVTLPEEGVGALERVANILGAPLFAVTGLVEETVTERGGGLGEGLLRAGGELAEGVRNIPGVDLVFDKKVPIAQQETFAQIMEQSGVGEMGRISDLLPGFGESGSGSFIEKGGFFDITGRGTLGFGLDIILDPLPGVGKAGSLSRFAKEVGETGLKFTKKGLKAIADESATLNRELLKADFVAQRISNINKMRKRGALPLPDRQLPGSSVGRGPVSAEELAGTLGRNVDEIADPAEVRKINELSKKLKIPLEEAAEVYEKSRVLNRAFQINNTRAKMSRNLSTESVLHKIAERRVTDRILAGGDDVADLAKEVRGLAWYGAEIPGTANISRRIGALKQRFGNRTKKALEFLDSLDGLPRLVARFGLEFPEAMRRTFNKRPSLLKLPHVERVFEKAEDELAYLDRVWHQSIFEVFERPFRGAGGFTSPANKALRKQTHKQIMQHIDDPKKYKIEDIPPEFRHLVGLYKSITDQVGSIELSRRFLETGTFRKNYVPHFWKNDNTQLATVLRAMGRSGDAEVVLSGGTIGRFGENRVFNTFDEGIDVSRKLKAEGLIDFELEPDWDLSVGLFKRIKAHNRVMVADDFTKEIKLKYGSDVVREVKEMLEGKYPGMKNVIENGIAQTLPDRKTVRALVGAAKELKNTDGTPTMFFHGTRRVFDSFSRSAGKSGDLFSNGIYFTDSPAIADSYAGWREEILGMDMVEKRILESSDPAMARAKPIFEQLRARRDEISDARLKIILENRKALGIPDSVVANNFTDGALAFFGFLMDKRHLADSLGITALDNELRAIANQASSLVSGPQIRPAYLASKRVFPADRVAGADISVREFMRLAKELDEGIRGVAKGDPDGFQSKFSRFEKSLKEDAEEVLSDMSDVSKTLDQAMGLELSPSGKAISRERLERLLGEHGGEIDIVPLLIAVKKHRDMIKRVYSKDRHIHAADSLDETGPWRLLKAQGEDIDMLFDELSGVLKRARADIESDFAGPPGRMPLGKEFVDIDSLSSMGPEFEALAKFWRKDAGVSLDTIDDLHAVYGDDVPLWALRPENTSDLLSRILETYRGISIAKSDSPMINFARDVLRNSSLKKARLDAAESAGHMSPRGTTELLRYATDNILGSRSTMPDVLKHAGYDALEYKGGQRAGMAPAGGRHHRALVVYNEKAIIPTTAANTLVKGEQMTGEHLKRLGNLFKSQRFALSKNGVASAKKLPASAKAVLIRELFARTKSVSGFEKTWNKYRDIIQEMDSEVYNKISQVMDGTRAAMRRTPDGEIMTTIPPDVMSRLTKSTGRSTMEQLKGVHLPVSIVDELVDFETFDNPIEAKKWLKTYDTLSNFFKQAVTIWFPSFHLRNAYSNIAQSFLDIGIQAMNPARYKQALGVMSGHEGTMVSKLGRKYTYSAIQDYANLHGVIIEAGHFTELTGKGGIRQRAISKFVKDRAADVENSARMVHFISGLRNGLSPVQAAERTKKFLFDYANISKMEREWLSRAIPFYRWTRKNIALQLESVVQRPGKVASLIKPFQPSLRGPDQEQLPDYLRGDLRIRLQTPPGKAAFVTGIDLPITDLNRIFDGRGRRTIAQNLATLNPVIKIPFEFATGRDLFTLRKHSANAGALAWLPKPLKDWAGIQTIKDDITGEERTIGNPTAMYLLLRSWAFARLWNSSEKIHQAATSAEEGAMWNLVWNLTVGVRTKEFDMTEQQERMVRTKAKRLEQFLVDRGLFKEFSRGFVAEGEAGDILGGR